MKDQHWKSPDIKEEVVLLSCFIGKGKGGFHIKSWFFCQKELFNIAAFCARELKYTRHNFLPWTDMPRHHFFVHCPILEAFALVLEILLESQLQMLVSWAEICQYLSPESICVSTCINICLTPFDLFSRSVRANTHRWLVYKTNQRGSEIKLE